MKPSSYTLVKKCCANCWYAEWSTRDQGIQCIYGEPNETIDKLKSQETSGDWLNDFFLMCRVKPYGICDKFEADDEVPF